MALEAAVFQQDLFGHGVSKEVYNLLGGNWSSDFEALNELLVLETRRGGGGGGGGYCSGMKNLEKHQYSEENYGCSGWNLPPDSKKQPPLKPILNGDSWVNHKISCTNVNLDESPPPSMTSRPRRRRCRTQLNEEQIENQRISHIFVERNRRKQMNEYLSVLRDLMPDSYVQRNDQASIIGGAINYVKELEQQLQFLGGQKQLNLEFGGSSSSSSFSLPFSEFLAFPQYSTNHSESFSVDQEGQVAAGNADIQVTVADSHASIKIRSKKRPKQLVKMVSGFQELSLTILHLNVTTCDFTVIYSVSVKVEDDCRLNTGDEIAFAVNQMLGRIQEESSLSFKLESHTFS